MSVVITQSLAKQAKALIKKNNCSVYLISDDKKGVWLAVYGASGNRWNKVPQIPVLLKLGVDESLVYPLQANLSREWHGTQDFKSLLQRIVKTNGCSVSFTFDEPIEGFDQTGKIQFVSCQDGVRFDSEIKFVSLKEDSWYYKEHVQPVKESLSEQQEQTQVLVNSKSLKTILGVLNKTVGSKNECYQSIFCQVKNGRLSVLGTDGFILLELTTVCPSDPVEFVFGMSDLTTMKNAITGETCCITLGGGLGTIGNKTFKTYGIVPDVEQKSSASVNAMTPSRLKEQSLYLLKYHLDNVKGWFSVKTSELANAFKLCHVFGLPRLIFDTVGLHTEEHSKGGCSYRLAMEGDSPTKAFCRDKNVEQMLKVCDKKGEAVLGYTTTDEFPNWLLKQAINEVYITGVFARCVPDEVKESNDENGEEYSDECGYEGSVEKSDIAAVEGASC